MHQENHNYPAGVDFTPDKKYMYVSMYGEATWQFWREDGLAFDDPTAGIVYEVEGGIDDGKTHEELGIPEAVTTKNPNGSVDVGSSANGSGSGSGSSSSSSSSSGSGSGGGSGAAKTNAAKVAAIFAGLIGAML